MKLKCKQNTFKQTKTIGLSVFKREESRTIVLPLTIGQEYQFSIVSDVDEKSITNLFESNALLKLQYNLLILTDNNKIEKVRLVDIVVDPELEQETDINKLIKSIFYT